MIAQRFDEARFALPEPLYYLPVPEFGLFVICELLVLLALGVESWDRIERSCVGHICFLKFLKVAVFDVTVVARSGSTG